MGRRRRGQVVPDNEARPIGNARVLRLTDIVLPSHISIGLLHQKTLVAASILYPHLYGRADVPLVPGVRVVPDSLSAHGDWRAVRKSVLATGDTPVGGTRGLEPGSLHLLPCPADSIAGNNDGRVVGLAEVGHEQAERGFLDDRISRKAGYVKAHQRRCLPPHAQDQFLVSKVRVGVFG